MQDQEQVNENRSDVLNEASVSEFLETLDGGVGGGGDLVAGGLNEEEDWRKKYEMERDRVSHYENLLEKDEFSRLVFAYKEQSIASGSAPDFYKFAMEVQGINKELLSDTEKIDLYIKSKNPEIANDALEEERSSIVSVLGSNNTLGKALSEDIENTINSLSERTRRNVYSDIINKAKEKQEVSENIINTWSNYLEKNKGVPILGNSIVLDNIENIKDPFQLSSEIFLEKNEKDEKVFSPKKLALANSILADPDSFLKKIRTDAINRFITFQNSKKANVTQVSATPNAVHQSQATAKLLRDKLKESQK